MFRRVLGLYELGFLAQRLGLPSWVCFHWEMRDGWQDGTGTLYPLD